MTASHFVIAKEDLSSVRLDPKGSLRRGIPRPPEQRQPGYEDTFDFFTLFYDCFRTASGIRFIGPPPIKLRNRIDHTEVTNANGTGLVRNRKDIHLSRIHKVFRMDLLGDLDDSHIDLSIPGVGERRVPVGESLFHYFEGKRVLLTMIKFDPLSWVKQWVEFFVRAHGIDAVLIYNNDALDYRSQDIVDQLKPINGLDMVGVIDWGFPYGPGVGPSGVFDSTFAQAGAMEHAMQRLLKRAKCVVNADVDELIFCHQPNDTICALTERSRTGYLRFSHQTASGPHGVQVDVPWDTRRYADHHFVDVLLTTETEGVKWSLVPERHGDEHECGAHFIRKMSEDAELSSQASVRLMPDFNTGWKNRPKDNTVRDFQSDDIMLRTFKQIGWL